MQWLVQFSLKTLKIYDENPPGSLSVEELEQNDKGRSLFLKCQFGAKIFLVFGLGIWLASLWGISFPFLSKLTTVVFDAAVILTIALLFWQFISSWIERKIKESMPEEEENDEDDEWGGASNRGRGP